MTYYGDYGFKDYLETGNYDYLWNPAAHNGFFCTCFAAMGSDSCRLFGRNFDFTEHIAFLLFTHPSDGYASVSMVHLSPLGYSEEDPVDSPGNRTALLRSATIPSDGMNECGVAIGAMQVDHAEPPYDPGKVTLHGGLVIRLVLDYAKNAEEAVELLRNYNVDFGNYPAGHFLISDSSGNSLIIEYLNNEMKVIRNTEKWQVCTNFIVTGTQAPNNVTCWRYNRAYIALKSNGGNIGDYNAMNILKGVAQGPPCNTMWSMVYDLKSLDILVAINRDYTSPYTFKLHQ
jgi:penicillin V acylase-like amidase (Ntn superfamily)